MQARDLFETLSGNVYPGRGIMLGRSADGANAVIAYFIMGRSENSRNRVFVTDGDGIRTQAFDESKVTDPSLIIYAPVRVLGGTTIVTNGDQTDTIYEGFLHGKTMGQALRTRTFEPDAPNYTPRISGVLEMVDGGFFYRLSILKSDDGDPSQCLRYSYFYDAPKAGEGRLIHTYVGDGSPLPSYEGDPARVTFEGDIDAFTENLWNSLNADNRVSLFVRYIPVDGGEAQTRIVNRHEGH